MPYVPTGFEMLPDILYRPLMQLQTLQFYEAGEYFAKQQKYELALKYLDWVSEPFVNPDKIPLKKQHTRLVQDLQLKTLKKKIEICCKLWLFDKARAELAALQKITGKSYKRLEHQIDAAWWSAAIVQLEFDGEQCERLGRRKCRNEQKQLLMEQLLKFNKLEQKKSSDTGLNQWSGKAQPMCNVKSAKKKQTCPRWVDLSQKCVETCQNMCSLERFHPNGTQRGYIKNWVQDAHKQRTYEESESSSELKEDSRSSEFSSL